MNWASLFTEKVMSSRVMDKYWRLNIELLQIPELLWIHSLLTELGVTIPKSPSLLCDNLSATYLTHNPVYHKQSYEAYLH